jgi:hypothetical protein
MALMPGDGNFDASYGLPEKQGLYDPSLEKDACGVGFVVSIDGIRSQQVSISLSYACHLQRKDCRLIM